MTTIVPQAIGIQRVGATFLRAHLRMLAAGMDCRGRKSDMLKKATRITGISYKRGEYDKAADDLTKWLEDQK